MILRLWTLLRPYRRAILAALVCTLLASVGLLAVPLVAKAFLTAPPGTDAGAAFMPWATLLAGLAAIALLSYGSNYLMIRTSQKVAADLRATYVGHLVRMPIPFHHHHQIGDLIDRMITGVKEIEWFVKHNLLSTGGSAVLLAGAVGMIFRVDGRLALLVCAVIPLAVVILRRLDTRVRAVHDSGDVLNAGVTATLHDVLLAADIVKAYGAEEVEAKRFRRKQDRVVARERRTAFLLGLSEPLVILVTVSVILTLVVFSRVLVVRGELGVDRLLLFMTYTLMLLPVARQVSLDYYRWGRIGSAFRRMDEIMELPIEEDSPDASDLPDRACGELHVKHLSYSYPGRSHALHDVTLRIAPRESVGIVGESGAGKSTLLNLLLRFYTPQAGTITIDGMDIRGLTLRSLRRSIAIVPQDIILFDDTILENVRYGRFDATQEEVDAACRDAQIHEFIQGLPDGYQTVVGGRGVRLSGGQRQRIAIARALIRNAPILLLDEATSSLDAHTEQLLHSATAAAMRGRTTLIIAHRLVTVMRLPRIIVMREGRLVAEGAHDELMSRCEYYSDLVRHQLIGAGQGGRVAV